MSARRRNEATPSFRRSETADGRRGNPRSPQSTGPAHSQPKVEQHLRIRNLRIPPLQEHDVASADARRRWAGGLLVVSGYE
ncbi:hypothetical protein [Arthrobacter methylotrophus]|uniref:hypothetical protein n=1 Tax=Arthrobacter methylotrophus TaxID=121291 RepID=UPI0031EA509E